MRSNEDSQGERGGWGVGTLGRVKHYQPDFLVGESKDRQPGGTRGGVEQLGKVHLVGVEVVRERTHGEHALLRAVGIERQLAVQQHRERVDLAHARPLQHPHGPAVRHRHQLRPFALLPLQTVRHSAV